MARGSFNGLYTFQDVSKIYNIDSSTIRKQVQNHKFYDHEIRKFGKTWLITEQAMVEHFGKDTFVAHKNELLRIETMEAKRIKEEAKRIKEEAKREKFLLKQEKEANKINAISLNGDDDDLPCDTWKPEKIDDRFVETSFTF